MALDHSRDFIHFSSVTQNPTNLATTTPILFFTRWITHLCAPSFVFLSGVSAFISFNALKDVSASRKFLITRGIWLVILEFTLVNFAIWFQFPSTVMIFEVIAAIGFGFIILGLCLKLPAKTLGIAGLVIIFGHNLTPLIPFADGSVAKQILQPLFVTMPIPLSKTITFIVGYPPIPWLGVMLVGFASGQFFTKTEMERKKLFFKLGIAALVLFVVIRFINVYGDSVPWSKQSAGVYTFLSFMNLSKHPPSLLYCLCMLGIMLLFLAFFEGKDNWYTRICSVYGKVPLFYFLVHFYLLHSIMLVIVLLQGYSFSDLQFGSKLGRPAGPSGLGLFWVYIIWITVVIVLYPVCKWYGKYKAEHREKNWLRYL